MHVTCQDCEIETEFSLEEWRCRCGGAWELAKQPEFLLEKINSADYTIWRYGSIMGLDVDSPKKRMGVGWTPLVPIELDGRNVHIKLEFLSPSGSFKDRGVNAMVHQLISMGVKSMMEDSSGNAGASLAAHAARYGIPTQIFVPSYASPAKKKQIAVYGVEVLSIDGLRIEAEKAAQNSVRKGKTYASHAYNPAYLAGQVTAAYEIWEQLGRKAPQWIICPVAQGGQFLGLWIGFAQLLRSGFVNELPRLVAVQSANIAPIFEAWAGGKEDIPAIEQEGFTVAEGVAISKPVRGRRLLQSLRDTKGMVVKVQDEMIVDAQKSIAKLGYFIEPTSALAVAGYFQILDQINEKDIVVLPLTGSGLKGLPQSMAKGGD